MTSKSRMVEIIEKLVDFIEYQACDDGNAIDDLYENLGITHEELQDVYSSGEASSGSLRQVAAEICGLFGDDLPEETISLVEDEVTERLSEFVQENKYKIAKEVELEDFKNALECLDYDPDDYTEEELKEMFETHFDALGNDDMYNSIYNETLEDVVKQHEKCKSVEGLISDAKQTCEEVNKDASKAQEDFTI